CQAVKSLELTTACHAIDTWKGDEHTGFYGEDFFERVAEHNNAHYTAFSRLVRSTFDEAVTHFSDGSIDLLHIDGRHFYEDVAHDFETWCPKLSSRAIVLFHDTNVREREFGVFKLWEELREKYPSFEFLHGHGLGVLGFGAELPAQMGEFFEAMRDADAAQQVREAYSRLGGAIKFEAESKAKQAQLKTWLNTQENRGDELEKRAARLESEVTALEAEVNETNARLEAQWDHNNTLEEESDHFRAQLEELRARLEHQQRVNQSLKNSTSWRITAPIRGARRMVKGIGWTAIAFVQWSARTLYRHAPLPQSTKNRVVDSLFRAMPEAFRRTAVFRDWSGARKKERSKPRLLQQRVPPKEAARALEDDFSLATPVGYVPSPPDNPRLAVICHLYYEGM
ncbi:MAG: class I SAM-dependent methyltransferase, partial [Rhodospirillaceae bacterium]